MLIGQPVPLVSVVFALIGQPFALVGVVFALVGQPLTLVGQSFVLRGLTLAPVRDGGHLPSMIAVGSLCIKNAP